MSDRQQLIRGIAEGHCAEPGPLMEVLHDVQTECGFVDRDDAATIASVLNLSIADVQGVISFYHDFATTPRRPQQVQLCRAEACQAVGANELWDQVSDDLGGDTDVSAVYCLGNCALGPSGTVNGQLFARLDADRVRGLVAGGAQ